ncbi:sensor histidine kinase [Acidaminococcus sp.]|uniref:sensor histidine kinase n=1 Tax=Acidaminococcus sp. TaxID=1872103 RepID=UPI003D7EB207
MNQVLEGPFLLVMGMCAAGLLGLLSQGILIYGLLPLGKFRSWRRKGLESCILGILILFCTWSLMLLEAWLGEKVPFPWLRILQMAFCLGILGFSWIRPEKGTGCLSAWAAAVGLAGLFSLTEAGAFWGYGAVLGLVLWRNFREIPRVYQQNQGQITVYSIQEAIDSLEDGVLITLFRGDPVLMNLAMFRYVEQILGLGVRNGNVLWHLLQEVRKPGLYREKQGGQLLFCLADGRWILFRRESLLLGEEACWQLTASEVTELQRLNVTLERQTQQLQQQSTELKERLGHLQELQSRETLQELRIRLHDLLGQRISLLQQVLNNHRLADYSRIIPLVGNLLSDVREEIRVEPRVQLKDLIAVYRRLGVGVTLRGTLPAGGKREELVVRILREALTNAVCHGRASQVTLVLRPEGIVIQDNGTGCSGSIREGGGLSGIRRRVEQAGGTVEYRGMHHFTLKVRWRNEEKVGEKYDPNPVGG